MRPTLPLAVGLVLPSVALAATIAVPGDVATITEAIKDAEPGDLIEVAAGSYREQLQVQKNLTIRGAGSSTTTLGGNGTVVSVSDGATLTMEDFKVDPGTRAFDVDDADLVLNRVEVSGGDATVDGVGIRAQNGAHLTLTDCVFDDNIADGHNGGHVWVHQSSLTATTTAFSDGVARWGGAIYAFDATVLLTGSDFDHNYAVATGEMGSDGRRAGGTGAAIFAAQNSVVTLDGGTFASGDAGNYGGYIALDSSELGATQVTFQGGLADLYGGALYGIDSDLVLDDVTLLDNGVDDLGDGKGGGIYLDGGLLTVTGGQILGGQGGVSGGGVFGLGATLDVLDTAFEDNAADQGGGIGAVACDTTITGASFTANDFGVELGGGIASVDGGLQINGALFTGNVADSGGAIGSRDALVEIADSVFEDNEATALGGAVLWQPAFGSTSLAISDTVFTNNQAGMGGGGAWLTGGDEAAITGSSFHDNGAPIGGGVGLSSLGTAQVVRGLLCANAATADGGGVWASSVGTTTIRNTVIAENTATARGGGLYWIDGDAVLDHVDFLGNAAAAGGGALADDDGDLLRFTNNVVAWSTGDGVTEQDNSGALSDPVLSWNLFYDNTAAHLSGRFDGLKDDGNLFDLDPELAAYTANGDCSDDAFWPAVGSPLVDAGDPAEEDLDESRADIGAYGGPSADPAAWTDADGDGWLAVQDCDDADPDVNPDATEVPYDGIDNDCIDGDLVDVDGDGYDAEVAGGDDCDDDDPDVNPGAAEVGGNDVDEDCDGVSDGSTAGRTWDPTDDGGYDPDALVGCSCQVAPAPAMLSWLLALAAVVGLRRRYVSRA